MDENIAENMVSIRIYCRNTHYDEIREKLANFNRTCHLMHVSSMNRYVLSIKITKDEYLVLKLTYTGIPEVEITVSQ